MKKNTKRKNAALTITRAAAVGALYFILTWISGLFGLSSGVIQFRISEALCIMPLFFPEATLGLFIGCLISNVLTSGVIWDVLFGSLATLIGALGALFMRRLPKSLAWLAPIPTVVANVVIVPLVLTFAMGASEALGFIALTVFIGEAVCAWLLGAMLYYFLTGSPALSKLLKK